MTRSALRLAACAFVGGAFLLMVLDPLLVAEGWTVVPLLWPLTVVGVAAAVLALLARAKLPLEVGVLLLWMAAFVTWSAVSASWGRCEPLRSGSQLATLIYLLSQAVALLLLATWSRCTWRVPAWIIMISTLCLLLLGLWRGTLYQGVRVVPSLGYNPTWLGGYAAVGLLLALIGIAESPRKLGWLAAAMGMTLSLLVTQSRSASISVALALIVATVIWASRSWTVSRRRLSVGAVRLVLIIVLLSLATWGAWRLVGPTLPESVPELSRFALLWSGDPDLATAGRFTMWQRFAAEMTSPWGVGVGCFQGAFTGVYGYERLPHNQWLYAYGELGVVGVILFGAFCAWCVRQGARMARAKGPPEGALWFYVVLLTAGNDVLFYQYWVGAVLVAGMLTIGDAE